MATMARRRERRTERLFVWLLVAAVVGSGAVYLLNLWRMKDPLLSSSKEKELLRRQFDRANMEAMDESAEWRMRYDSQLLATNSLQNQLSKVKADFVRTSNKLENLQKDKDELQNLVERLKRRCNCSIR